MGFFSDIFTGRHGEVQRFGLLNPDQEDALGRLIRNLEKPRTTRPSLDTSLAALEASALARGQGQLESDQATDALNELLSGEPTDFDEFYEKGIRDPLLKDFNEFLLPEVQNQFGGSNRFTADRERATNKAVRDMFDTLAGKRSELAFSTTESAKQRQAGATQTAANMAGILPAITQAITKTESLDDERIRQLLAAIGIPTIQNINVGRKEGGLDFEQFAGLVGGIFPG